MIPLKLHGLDVKHKFILADIKKPILGSDFFRSHNLLIDIPGQCLSRGSPSSPLVRARPASFFGSVNGLRCVASQVLDLFAQFPSVTQTAAAFDSSKPAKHGLTHTIPTTGPPVFARARRLFGEKLDVAKSEFQKMMDLGIVRPSSSAWASPLHVVPKANGGWRPCGDYRRLNLATKDDRYPLPHIHSFSAVTFGATFFLSLIHI